MDALGAPARLAGYLAILAVVSLGAFGVGRAVGPIGDDAPSPHGTSSSHDLGAATH